MKVCSYCQEPKPDLEEANNGLLICGTCYDDHFAPSTQPFDPQDAPEATGFTAVF